LAVGGWFDPIGTANMDPFSFPFAMYVDYVRVYELIGRELNVLPPETSVPPRDFIKEPLPNGNMIWNGDFNQGPNAIIFWHMEPGTGEMGVTARDPKEHGINLPPFIREFYVRDIDENTVPEDVMLWQSYAVFQDGNYSISFYAGADAPRTIEFRLTSLDGVVYFRHVFDINGEDSAGYYLQFELNGLGYYGTELMSEFLFGGSNIGVRLRGIKLTRMEYPYGG